MQRGWFSRQSSISNRARSGQWNSSVSITVVGGADKERGMSVKAHRELFGSNFLLISTVTGVAPYKRLQPTASERVPRSRNGMGQHGETAA
jgi:hypothetical protein